MDLNTGLASPISCWHALRTAVPGSKLESLAEVIAHVGPCQHPNSDDILGKSCLQPSFSEQARPPKQQRGAGGSHG